MATSHTHSPAGGSTDLRTSSADSVEIWAGFKEEIWLTQAEQPGRDRGNAQVQEGSRWRGTAKTYWLKPRRLGRKGSYTPHTSLLGSNLNTDLISFILLDQSLTMYPWLVWNSMKSRLALNS